MRDRPGLIWPIENQTRNTQGPIVGGFGHLHDVWARQSRGPQPFTVEIAVLSVLYRSDGKVAGLDRRLGALVGLSTRIG
jgi:hypothetical protein